jgi:DNA uptake protein ComE-like DNA-binding protein
MKTHRAISPADARRQRASVLIIVLWVAFGLVSLTLYFGHSMSLELRAADNRVAALEAEQAIDGMARYLKCVITNSIIPGQAPYLDEYQNENVEIGEARCWIIGRDNNQTENDRTYFGVVDEASKLNLNTATVEMLEMLPRMTPELAAAIIDWRDSDSTPGDGGGAEDDVYARLQPPRTCKNGPFESVEELRLVYGMDQTILFGEDFNQNGILDLNENDGNASPPEDNMDGRLDPGLVEYLTVYSKQTDLMMDGTPRINIHSNLTELQQMFSTNSLDANQILSHFRGTGGSPGGNQPGGGNGIVITNDSLLGFYVQSEMSADDFMKIEGSLTVSNGTSLPGLVNVATASEIVLECIPGIGTDYASALVAYRMQNPDRLNSVTWVKEVITDANLCKQIGPYITGESYQYSADIAAVGHHGRGFRRVRYVFDASDLGYAPKIVNQRDLTHLGMAFGTDVQETLKLAKEQP